MDRAEKPVAARPAQHNYGCSVIVFLVIAAIIALGVRGYNRWSSHETLKTCPDSNELSDLRKFLDLVGSTRDGTSMLLADCLSILAKAEPALFERAYFEGSESTKEGLRFILGYYDYYHGVEEIDLGKGKIWACDKGNPFSPLVKQSAASSNMSYRAEVERFHREWLCERCGGEASCERPAKP